MDILEVAEAMSRLLSACYSLDPCVRTLSLKAEEFAS
jgi:hypothetical protein